jgi:radical S-adenosyl methionine domain-containing protein 2
MNIEETKADFLTVPVSVNYFCTRECNFSCRYCFHTEKSRGPTSVNNAKAGLTMLTNAGMRKVNFSGGEPFLYANEFLGPVIEFCKEELFLESVSIVSNGSLIRREWLARYGQYVDILAVSCDSFDPSVNRSLGRGNGHIVAQLPILREWCDEYGMMFKINTVVTSLNWREDMNAAIAQLRPFRWKCFQVLLLTGENAGGPFDIMDARPYVITKQEFSSFIDRHRQQPFLIAEDNSSMQNSYLLLDERLRFLNCRHGDKRPSDSILEVGVTQALRNSGFDADMFFKRGGMYD